MATTIPTETSTPEMPDFLARRLRSAEEAWMRVTSVDTAPAAGSPPDGDTGRSIMFRARHNGAVVRRRLATAQIH